MYLHIFLIAIVLVLFLLRIFSRCFPTCILLFYCKYFTQTSASSIQKPFFLRWTVKLSGAIFVALLVVLSLEPNLLQTPRGQISVAGFDFALANLLAYANEESMAEQNLTIVTAIIAGAFFLFRLSYS